MKATIMKMNERHFTYTFDEFDVLLKAYTHDVVNDNDDDYTPGDATAKYLGNMHDEIKTSLHRWGLDWDHDAKTLTLHCREFDGRLDRTGLDAMNALFVFIEASYDAQTYSVEPMGWGPLLSMFGGDDDVDYNSSYPSIIVDCLLAIHFA